MSIKENLERIRNDINEACIKSSRSSDAVKLMAVSKFHPSEAVLEALACNQFLFGENRVQEASSKFPEILASNPKTELHMIGQLQTNKVKDAVAIASCIQSVDRLKLVQEIEKQCSKINKTIKILFELHTAEDSKSGFSSVQEIEEVLGLFTENNFPHIIPSGFMTMAPFTEDVAAIHKSFITLRGAAENLNKQFPMFNMTELSMGMSGDFKIAIEEGSTLVRVGTAIFGERDYSK